MGCFNRGCNRVRPKKSGCNSPTRSTSFIRAWRKFDRISSKGCALKLASSVLRLVRSATLNGSPPRTKSSTRANHRVSRSSRCPACSCADHLPSGLAIRRSCKLLCSSSSKWAGVPRRRTAMLGYCSTGKANSNFRSYQLGMAVISRMDDGKPGKGSIKIKPANFFINTGSFAYVDESQAIHPTSLKMTRHFLGEAAGRVVIGTAGFDFATLTVEDGEMGEPETLQSKLQRSRQHPEAVFHAAAEVDGRCFLEITRWAGNFADAESEVGALRQHLIVEDEVIGIFQKRQFRQSAAAEGTIASVVLR